MQAVLATQVTPELMVRVVQAVTQVQPVILARQVTPATLVTMVQVVLAAPEVWRVILVQ